MRSAFPGVEDRDPESAEILDVAGHQGELVDRRGGGDQAVNTGKLHPFVESSRGEDAPALRDGFGNRYEAFFEPSVKVNLQPLLQLAAPSSRSETVDAFADLAEANDARP